MNKLELKYFKLYGDVLDIKKSTSEAACFDIHAYFGIKSRTFTVYTKDNSKTNYMAFKKTLDDTIHTILNPGDRALLPTGIILDIPIGYSVRTHARSGNALKMGLILPNGEGIIDSDYYHECFIPILNSSSEQIIINHGDRIAQLEMIQVLDYDAVVSMIKPEQKTNRIGGFGSTGK